VNHKIMSLLKQTQEKRVKSSGQCDTDYELSAGHIHTCIVTTAKITIEVDENFSAMNRTNIFLAELKMELLEVTWIMKVVQVMGHGNSGITDESCGIDKCAAVK